MSSAVVTRFAPSPSGALHLGNARTALFNWLLARRSGGRFLLRIEDTDAERSTPAAAAALLDDLRWFGLEWDAGPDREDAQGPYVQSARSAHYAKGFESLERAGLTFPCYCSPTELEVSRRTQLAAGRPPRYAGTCRDLTAAERQAREAAGRRPTLRFRVPAAREVLFEDLVRGPQRFRSDDLGDFVIRRADGTAAFFFCNALDDAAMGVTQVLRGEDHLSNTPRQLLLLEALRQTAPAYGHLPLLTGADGVPLSKRAGATSLQDLRGQGILPAAVRNHLCRLGHAYERDGWLDDATMAEGFSVSRLGRAPAHADAVQLAHWQHEALRRADVADLLSWAGNAVPANLPAATAAAFVSAVRDNIGTRADVSAWARQLFEPAPALDPALRAIVAAAGQDYFAVALDATTTPPVDLPALIAALKARTGRKGRALFEPLRVILTRRAEGPELAPLLALMPFELLRARLAEGLTVTLATDR